MEKVYLWGIDKFVSTPLGWFPMEVIDEVIEHAGIKRVEHPAGFWQWVISTQKVPHPDSSKKDLNLPIGLYNFELALMKAKHILREKENTIEVVKKAISFNYRQRNLMEYIDPDMDIESTTYTEMYSEYENKYYYSLI